MWRQTYRVVSALMDICVPMTSASQIQLARKMTNASMTRSVRTAHASQAAEWMEPAPIPRSVMGTPAWRAAETPLTAPDGTHVRICDASTSHAPITASAERVLAARTRHAMTLVNKRAKTHLTAATAGSALIRRACARQVHAAYMATAIHNSGAGRGSA